MQADKQTRDLKRSCLCLRDGLLFVPQQHGGETFYHIENTAASRFYRVGYAQYIFISLLDGKTSFSAALALTARQLGAQALTEHDATQLSLWLLRNELVRFADASKHGFKGKPKSGHPTEQFLSRLNPFWLKLPFGCPDRVFATALPYCAWMFHPLAVMAGVLVAVAGGLVLMQEWSEFARGVNEVFSPQNWLWMLICWVGLKVVHEFAHGIACKYLGGDVKETGLIFILFAPMAYVDVTSTWRFPSKWKRILVASAGMLAELLIAAIAVIAWSRSDSPVVSQLLHNLILMAGLSTILFNANPLMRFDGYFILSDLLEIPNLYEEGAKQVQRLTGWLFFGRSHAAFTTTRAVAHTGLLQVYGIAASAWKLLVGVTLMIGASTMFHGAGIVLGAAGVLIWFGLPLLRGLKSLRHQFFESRPAFFRAVMVCSLLGLSLWGLWDWSPCPAALHLPCIVDYEAAAFVRADTSGFLEQVFVEDGQEVEAGTPLLRLRNEELRVDVQRLTAELKQSEQRARIARDQHEPSVVQIEREQQRSIRRELSDKESQLAALIVSAPRRGRVVAEDLGDRIGTYYQKGNDLLILGNESQKECIVSVSQDDIQDAFAMVGESVRVRIGSRGSVVGKLKRIEPRASNKMPHDGFAATMGGPISVREVSGYREERGEANVEFSEPRFTGAVSLSATDAKKLASGERGQARLGRRSETFGRWFYNVVRDYIEQRTQQTAAL